MLFFLSHNILLEVYVLIIFLEQGAPRILYLIFATANSILKDRF